jgi:hypothetical protein
LLYFVPREGRCLTVFAFIIGVCFRVFPFISMSVIQAAASHRCDAAGRAVRSGESEQDDALSRTITHQRSIPPAGAILLGRPATSKETPASSSGHRSAGYSAVAETVRSNWSDRVCSGGRWGPTAGAGHVRVGRAIETVPMGERRGSEPSVNSTRRDPAECGAEVDTNGRSTV